LRRYCNSNFWDDPKYQVVPAWFGNGNDMRYFPVNLCGFSPLANAACPVEPFPKEMLNLGGVKFQLVDPAVNRGKACLVLNPQQEITIKFDNPAYGFWFLGAAEKYLPDGTPVLSFSAGNGGSEKTSFKVGEHLNVYRWPGKLLKITGKGSAVRRIQPKHFSPGKLYVASCRIKPNGVKASKKSWMGLGFGVTFWSKDWKQAQGIHARAGGNEGKWLKVVGKPTALPDWIHNGRVQVSNAYAGGSGLVDDLWCGEAFTKLKLHVEGPGIKRVTISDDTGKLVFDSQVLTQAPDVFEKEIKVPTPYVYTVRSQCIWGCRSEAGRSRSQALCRGGCAGAADAGAQERSGLLA
jgi:hypothetical protein